jgi:hypothetical protein
MMIAPLAAWPAAPPPLWKNSQCGMNSSWPGTSESNTL